MIAPTIVVIALVGSALVIDLGSRATMIAPSSVVIAPIGNAIIIDPCDSVVTIALIKCW